MENSEKCPQYILGNAREDYLFRNKVVFCSAKICQYNKEFVTPLNGENITLCQSKGLLKKIELENPNKTKKVNTLQTSSVTKFNGKIPNPIYLQFQ